MSKRFEAVVCCLLVLGASFAFIGVASAAPMDLTDYKIVRVEVKTAAELEQLEGLATTILSDYPGIRPLEAVIAPDRMGDLLASGLSVEVLHQNIQELIELERQPVGRGTWDAYMNRADLIQFINDLATARPDLCEVFSIGTSIEGRDIWVLHITGPGGSNKPAVFYHSLIHCREWITAPVVLYLADYLVNNYGTDPDATALVDGLDIYLAPCVNPDGYEYTWNTYRLWRKNRRNNGDGTYGVDLNRNWAYGWGGGGSSGYTGDETYRGPSPFSEPETTVLSDFIAAHPRLVSYMDYHSYSQLILWPYGYECLGGAPEPDGTEFWNIGSTMQSLIQAVHGKYYEAGPICETIYQASGGSVDWVYGDQDVFGFTIELRDTGTYGFELPPAQILPTCEENLPAILHLSEWALAQVETRFGFPNGLPEEMAPGQAEVIDVEIIPIGEDLVGGSAAMFYRYDGGAFVSVPLTPLGGDSYEVTLPAPGCYDTPEFYFSATGTSSGVNYAPAGAPTTTYTASVTTPTYAVHEFPLDTNPGWTTQGQWAFGVPTGDGGEYGGPDPTSGHTGSNVYGYNLNGDYANSLSQTHLTSPALNCTGYTGLTLSFWRWLGVEQPQYDHAYVRISTNGSNWTTLWENTVEVTDEEWVYQEFDISSIADNQATVYLRWTMGATDGGWRYCGWNIDDIAISWSIDTAACSGILPGDMDGTGDLNGLDIGRFVDVLLVGPANDDERCAADVNEDCEITPEDIGALVDALL